VRLLIKTPQDTLPEIAGTDLSLSEDSDYYEYRYRVTRSGKYSYRAEIFDMDSTEQPVDPDAPALPDDTDAGEERIFYVNRSAFY
jgi:hypothetical protein